MTAEFIFLNDTIRIDVVGSFVRSLARIFAICLFLMSHRVYVLNLLYGIRHSEHNEQNTNTMRLQMIRASGIKSKGAS